MKKGFFKKILCFSLAAITALSTGGFSVEAAPADPQITINDNDVGTGQYQFEYSSSWVHEGGYPDRFYSGDEHWTTTAQFGTQYPWFVLRFVGTAVTIYGHKVPAGALASVTIDGKDAGQIDYYSSSRVEKTELFSIAGLTNDAHEIKVQLLAQSNPAAQNTHEASVDYAVVTAPDAQFPVTGISVARSSLFLETGMTAKIPYLLTPDYANVTPALSFSSSDKTIADVSADGIVTAKAEGEATVTIRADGVETPATIVVTVKKNNGQLAGFVADDNTRTPSVDYPDVLEVYYGTTNVSWSGVAWRNDTATSRLVLYTKEKDVKNVTVTAGVFKNNNNDTLPPSCISVSFIADTLAHDSGEQIADIIWGNDKTDMSASTLRSVWVSFTTPTDAAPGLYSGEITVTADGGISLVFPYTLEVIALTCPESADGGVQLELWQYPYSVDRYYSGKTSEAYFGSTTEALRKITLNPAYAEQRKAQVAFYAAAGGRAITVTCVEDPWNSQTPDPYPSMIKWTKNENGTFSFDYADFDEWVALNLECGVNGQIKTFSIACWGNKITYLDEKTGKTLSQSLTPGSADWNRIWSEFLRDYMQHTKEMGWFDLVYIAMDERGFDEVKSILDLVESVKDENGKSFKTSLCVFQWETESLFDRVTDLSLAYGMDGARVREIAQARREAGLLTTLYTCGAQCSSLRNPPYESLFAMLRCAQRGTDGFLRWALNAFNEDPLHTSENKNFASGDVFLIYPSDIDDPTGTVRSSVRFEKIAQGIRTLAKANALRAHSIDTANQVDLILSTLGAANGGDEEKEALRILAELNRLSRIVALETLVKEAEALNADEGEEDTAPAEALRDVITDAKMLLEMAYASDSQLCAQSETLAAAIVVYRQSTKNESPDIEEETEPENSTTTDKDTGCGSALAAGALPLLAIATAGALAKPKKERKKKGNGKR